MQRSLEQAEQTLDELPAPSLLSDLNLGPVYAGSFRSLVPSATTTLSDTLAPDEIRNAPRNCSAINP
jgi:hypothetical protein